MFMTSRVSFASYRVGRCSAENVGKQHLLAALSDDCFSQQSSDEGEMFAGFRACRTVDPLVASTTSSKSLSASSPHAAGSFMPTAPTGSILYEGGWGTPLCEPEMSASYASLSSPPSCREMSRKDSPRAVSLILEEVTVSETSNAVAEKWEECDLPLLLYDRSDMNSVRYMRQLLKSADKPVVLVSMNNEDAAARTPPNVRCVFYQCGLALSNTATRGSRGVVVLIFFESPELSTFLCTLIDQRFQY